MLGGGSQVIAKSSFQIAIVVEVINGIKAVGRTILRYTVLYVVLRRGL